MKLAISNIAWAAEDDAVAADLMTAHGLRGVEIAPSRVWPAPTEASAQDIAEHRRFWESRDLQIVAMQALLYGRPDLTIFHDASVRSETGQYLRTMMRVAQGLGARVLVFGSPRNRHVGDLPAARTEKIAVDFFHEMGSAATDHDVILCIEANPTQYDCDFITTTQEALALVQLVGSPGFGLHLDTGGMTLSNEPMARTLQSCAGSICHFHVSEPYLASVGQGPTDHSTVAASLREIAYDRWVSVEMRRDPAQPIQATLSTTLQSLRETYGR